MEINFEPTIKQHLLFEYFDDEEYLEILYGGAAGGGKSYGLCALIVLKCLIYSDIRVGLARNTLTTLKKTTVTSLFEVLKDFNIDNDEYVKYNSVAGEFRFNNGSKIILCELQSLPSDPEYTRLGGLLLTFGAIDEAGEVNERGKNIFQSRFGRWLNKEYDIKPKLFMTCNPSKNFLYDNFYLPYKEGRLESFRTFIPTVLDDNPYLSEEYKRNLILTLNTIDKERLLKGNWEYDDDPLVMIDSIEIENMFISQNEYDFIKEYKKNLRPNRFLSIDVAFTRDKCVICLWEDDVMIDVFIDPEDLDQKIMEIKTEYNIPNYNISYDGDGVGKYLKQKLRGSMEIINNGQPINKENYKNLKTQLYYKLADEIKDNKIKILLTEKTNKYIKQIKKELSVIKYKESKDDTKKQMISKDEVKQLLGNSPDFTDAMAYKMIFNIKNTGSRKIKVVV